MNKTCLFVLSPIAGLKLKNTRLKVKHVHAWAVHSDDLLSVQYSNNLQCKFWLGVPAPNQPFLWGTRAHI